MPASLDFSPLSEISGPTGIRATSFSKYMRELSEVFDLVEREAPVTEKSWRSKKSRYKINDLFIVFWMRFIHRQLSAFMKRGTTASIYWRPKVDLPLGCDKLKMRIRFYGTCPI
jgi:AAA+ ATPase superfamily predicted ATPase